MRIVVIGGSGRPSSTRPSSRTIRSGFNGGPVRFYRAGENFFERPGDRRDVSVNDSATEPAQLLAVLVVATAERVLTTPMRH